MYFAVFSLLWLRVSLVSQMVRNLPTVLETWVQFLGWGHPLEKGMATHSSILACRYRGQRNLAGYSPGNRKESDKTEQLTFSLSL